MDSLQLLQWMIVTLLQEHPQRYLGTDEVAVGPGVSAGGEPTVEITFSDGTYELHLVNLHRELLRSSVDKLTLAHIDSVLQQRLHNIRSIHRPSWDDARTVLTFRLLHMAPHEHVLVHPWGDLLLAPVMDWPNHLNYTMKWHVHEWNVDEDDVFAVAWGNFLVRDFQFTVGPANIDLPFKMWRLRADGNFDAAYLAHPRTHNAFPIERSNQWVVIPARNLVLVTSKMAGSEQDLKFVAKRLHDTSAYALSPHVYEWRDGCLRRAF